MSPSESSLRNPLEPSCCPDICVVGSVAVAVTEDVIAVEAVDVVATVVGVDIWVAEGVITIVTCEVEGVGVDTDELDEVSYGHVSSPTPSLHISSTATTNI